MNTGTILVTGASGCIGAHLVRALLAQGETVAILLLPDDAAPFLQDVLPDVDIRRGNVLSPGDVRRAMHGISFVYHAAGIASASAAEEPHMWAVNVNGTNNVLEAAHEFKVKRVVHVSSIAAVGYPDGFADESFAYNGADIPFAYMHTKHAAERAAQHWLQQGLDVVMVCPAAVIAPYACPHHGWGRIFLDIAQQRMKINPCGGISYLTAHDLTQGLLLAMHHGRKSERYILTSGDCSYAMLIQTIAKVIGVKHPTWVLPPTLLRMASLCFKWLKPIITKLAPRLRINAGVLELLCRNAHYHTHKAQTELGFKPNPDLNQAVLNTWNWLHNEMQTKNPSTTQNHRYAKKTLAPIVAPFMPLILATIGLGNHHPAAAETLPLKGVLSSRIGVDDEGNQALEEFRVQLEHSSELNQTWSTQTRVSAYRENQLDGQYTERLDIERLYAQYQGQKCTTRLGIQEVIWGKADRLQVLDVIHPLDLTESYFGDWQRKHLPLAMLNTECGNNEESLQVVLVPQARYDRMPDANGRFATPNIGQTLAKQGANIADAAKRELNQPSDWSGGVQWTKQLEHGDLTLNYYHGWQGDAVYEPSTNTPGTYQRKPAQFDMIGGSYTQPVGPVVMRGEAAFTKGQMGYTRMPNGILWPVDTEQTSVLLGMDYTAEPWFYSVQWSHRSIASNQANQPLATTDEFQTITAALRRSFLQDRLIVAGFGAWDCINQAHYLSLQARYEWTSQLLFSVNAEMFDGNTKSFGQFSNQNRIWLGLEFHF